MRIKKIITIGLFATTLPYMLYAENTLPIATQKQDESIANNLINAQANSNNNVITTTETKEVTFTEPVQQIAQPTYKPVPIKPYTDEKMLIHLQNMNLNNGNKFVVEQNKNFNFVPASLIKEKNTLLANQRNNKQESDNLQERLNNSFKATCLVGDNIMVSDASVIAKTLCKTDNNNFVQLIFNLVPNNGGMALVGVPKSYIKNNKQTLVDEKNSYINNYSDSSNNIATKINTREVRKNLLAFGSGVSNGLTTASNQAIDQLRQSMTTQTSNVVGSGLSQVVVQDTNTKRPTSDDYRDYGVIGLASGIVQGISKVADNLTSSTLPWLYYIEKGSVLNVYIVPAKIEN